MQLGVTLEGVLCGSKDGWVGGWVGGSRGSVWVWAWASCCKTCAGSAFSHTRLQHLDCAAASQESLPSRQLGTWSATNACLLLHVFKELPDAYLLAAEDGLLCVGPCHKDVDDQAYSQDACVQPEVPAHICSTPRGWQHQPQLGLFPVLLWFCLA